MRRRSVLLCAPQSQDPLRFVRRRITVVFLICLASFVPGRMAAQQTVTVPSVPLAVQDGAAH
jgi:hypothetical protein